MSNFISYISRSTFSAAAGILPVITTLAVWVAGIPTMAIAAYVIGSVIIAIGPLMVALIDQWQRVRIVGQVLKKIDNADDAAKLLIALAPPTVNSTSRSAQKL
jgi:hypothetical protein